MSTVYKIKKGLDIKLHGSAEKIMIDKPSVSYALKPTDFHGVFPKLLVNEGDKVLAGTPVYYDKYREQILFTSPVSGVISEIKRGEKRVLLEIRISADKENTWIDYGKGDPLSMDRAAIADRMVKSGVWPVIRQRPFSVIANPADTPKAIFISCFDTAPLAPDYEFMVEGHGKTFQTGINALSKLTGGKIHLDLPSGNQNSKIFTEVRGVEINYISGPHPAGNVGVQIHHINPVNKGEVVWYLYPQDVLMIGRLFEEGRYNASTVIALTGSEVLKPRYYQTLRGASIHEMVAGNLNGGNLRYISGNVLTGKKMAKDGYVGFYENQVTVIPEGDYFEFFGWATPGFNKFSLSRTFLSWITPNRKYQLDTNLHGAERAIVMTGEFEKVFPMNIYPVHLIKAILVKDIELMENLGIYEVDEEDFALCEFIDTSKMEIQAIVREGLDYVRQEMS